MDAALPLVSMEGDRLNVAPTVSYGIAPILNALALLSGKSNRPYWSLYLINVETLIRDRKEEAQVDENYARSVLYDMDMLGQYIAAYSRLSMRGDRQKRPIICFYFPNYTVIPKVYFREKLPKGTEDRWKVRDMVMGIIQKEGAPKNYEEVEVLYDIVGRKGWPHREMLNDLVKHTEGIRFRNTLMVSHVPLDFHLYKHLNEFTILESYTGALKQPKQFGKKVFKEDVFPFNKYMHLLLGDKWYMQSLVKGADKKKMKERATKEHWAIIPEKSVLASLLSMKLMAPDLFIKPDL